MKKITSFLFTIALTIPMTALLEQKPAHAWMDFCNRTGDRIYVSMGWYEADDWQSAGWYELRDNSCRRHWPHELKESKRFYYKLRNKSGSDITPSGSENGYLCTKKDGAFHYADRAVKDF
jgi:uncharacterized membrane protein